MILLTENIVGGSRSSQFPGSPQLHCVTFGNAGDRVGYDLVKAKSLISLPGETSNGLAIALRSWAYVPLFAA